MGWSAGYTDGSRTVTNFPLAYFEFSPEWVVVVWSVLVAVLVLTAWLLDRRIFLAQALTPVRS
jgi:hypothetical protein